MNIEKLAFRNLISNPFNTFLSLVLMSLGVGIVSLIMLLNSQVEKQLQNNIKGIDMVIGAKGSPLQLILSSVYHVDNPTGNISYGDAKKATKSSMVDFKVPLSFGDSYKGFRIVGTTHQLIKLYEVKLRKGRFWNKSMEVIVGSLVADVNKLKIGDTFYGTHGMGNHGHVHDNYSYEVVGILKRSNSPLDKLIITDIQSVWQVHDSDGHSHEHEECTEHHHHSDDLENKIKSDLSIKDEAKITSMLVKFKSPVGLIQLPRKINETTNLQAAVPILEINRLTNLIGVGAQTINLIALIIIIVSGLSIFISLYNSLRKRRYELALMRVHGATKWQLIKLVLFEGFVIALIGTILGLMISRFSLYVINILANQKQMLNIIEYTLIKDEFWLFIISIFIGLLASFIAAIMTYKINLSKVLSDA